MILLVNKQADANNFILINLIPAKYLLSTTIKQKHEQDYSKRRH